MSKKRIFQEFSKFPLFGPFSRCFPAVFPLFRLFSRCFPAVFPLFPRCLADFLIFARFCGQNAQKIKNFRNLAQNSGFAAKTHKKTEFSEIWPRTEVLQPKRTKQQNFQKFCPKQVKLTKQQKFQRFCPEQVEKDKKNQISKILPRMGQNAPKNKFFRICAQNSGFCSQNAQKK